jgi:hypothetical protein
MISDVVDWARFIVGEAANILHDQEINGEALLQISQEDLERWGMKGGPAKKLISAIKSPHPSEGKSQKSFHFFDIYLSLRILAEFTSDS